jgi:nicotinamidase-related amidase
MVTVRDIIRFNTARVGGLIHELKENVKKNTEHAIRTGRSHYAGKGREEKLIHCRHIEPRHPEWGRYKALKAQATFWLIAGHVNHASRHRPQPMETLIQAAERAVRNPKETEIRKAVHVIQTLVNQIIEQKKHFIHVALWTRDREAEVAAYREAKARAAKETANA